MKVLTLLACLSLSVCVANPAAHSHAHKHGQHEREADGARSPIDHDHYKDGEHHSEFDHEAILGSRKDAEEFDDLPPEEAKRRLGILVKKMDGNSDGFVEDKELFLWIQNSFKKLTEEEAEERLDEEDENNDGHVTWDEHFVSTYLDDDDEATIRTMDDLDEEEQRFAKEEKELFTAADVNLDGKLSKQEFFKFNNPEEHPEMLSVALKHSMKEKDTNSDGSIDFNEYLGSEDEDDYEDEKEHFENIISGISKTKEDVLAEKESFNNYDKDRDGVLSMQEVAEWLFPNNDEIAREETNHLIAEADENSDNRLSYQEIIDNHDVFVGSEATQYGDSLHFMDEL